MNFAISKRGRTVGLDHLGIQVEAGEELVEVSDRLRTAGEPLLEQTATACCYARSDKTWVEDPQGIAWETFHTLGEETSYGEDVGEIPAAAESAPSSACCAPKKAAPAQVEVTAEKCCG